MCTNQFVPNIGTQSPALHSIVSTIDSGAYSETFDIYDPAIISCRVPFAKHYDVCLIIDIAQNYHPFLIGTKGKKCRDLMDLSKCTINFPNINRIPKGPKINNVVITGDVAQAEEVRKEMRCRTPIRLVVNNFKRKSEVLNLAIELAAEKHNFSTITYQVHKDSVYLKAEWSKDVALAYLCYDVFVEGDEVFSISLPCLSFINVYNQERNHHILQYIKDHTGCMIYYPEMEFVCNMSPALIVEGHDPFCVLLAARMLFGLTMFQLSFEMPRSFSIDNYQLKCYRRVHLVDVSIEEKCGSNDSCVVVLRTLEFCANKAYAIHSAIVGKDTEVRESGYEFMEDMVDLLPPDMFSNSHLYFTKQPFDPEVVYKKSASSEQFFVNFYGSPSEVARVANNLI